MILALLIGVAGGSGATARFLVDAAVTGLLSRRSPEPWSPWATLLINVTGSFALGVITAASTAGDISEQTRLVLGTGVCGGYTTFSTAMVETVRLDRRGARDKALAYWVGSLLVAIAAAYAGWTVGS